MWLVACATYAAKSGSITYGICTIQQHRQRCQGNSHRKILNNELESSAPHAVGLGGAMPSSHGRCSYLSPGRVRKGMSTLLARSTKAYGNHKNTKTNVAVHKHQEVHVRRASRSRNQRGTKPSARYLGRPGWCLQARTCFPNADVWSSHARSPAAQPSPWSTHWVICT